MKKFWQTAWQKKPFRITFWCGVGFAAACALFVLVCNLIVILTAYPHREDPEVLMDSEETYDCILVLGAGIKADGTLSAKRIPITALPRRANRECRRIP